MLLAAEHRPTLEVIEVCEDNDTSSFKRRRGFDRVLQLLRERAVDYVICFAEDRISRDALEVVGELVPWAEESGAIVVTSSGDEYDCRGYRGRAALASAGVEAEKERGRMAARSKLKHQQLFTEQRHVGMAPFGYRLTWDPKTREKSLEIVDEEAALIRSTVQRLLDGVPLRTLLGEWREAGTRTHRAGQIRRSRGRDGEEREAIVSGVWTPVSFKRLLCSPVLAGIRVRRVYRRSPISKTKQLEEVQEGPGAWPAIISPETHRALVRLLDAPERDRGGGRRDVRTSIPGSILRCGRCGGRMGAALTQRGRRVYRCDPEQPPQNPDGKSCPGVTIDLAMLEELVSWMIFAVLEETPAVWEGESGPADPDLRGELEQVQDNLVELNRQYWSVPRQIDPESYRAVKADLEGHADRLRRRMAQSQQGEARSAAMERLRVKITEEEGGWEEVWNGMLVRERRHLVAVCFDRIVVRQEGSRAGRPPKDPEARLQRVMERLDIVWAG